MLLSLGTADLSYKTASLRPCRFFERDFFFHFLFSIGVRVPEEPIQYVCMPDGIFVSGAPYFLCPFW
jgi:hypothetical protein